jgi:hypothetical protein
VIWLAGYESIYITRGPPIYHPPARQGSAGSNICFAVSSSTPIRDRRIKVSLSLQTLHRKGSTGSNALVFLVAASAAPLRQKSKENGRNFYDMHIFSFFFKIKGLGHEIELKYFETSGQF